MELCNSTNVSYYLKILFLFLFSNLRELVYTIETHELNLNQLKSSTHSIHLGLPTIEECIITTPQLKTWDAYVSKACPWFIKWPFSFNPPIKKLESFEVGSTQDEDTLGDMLDDTEVAPKPVEKMISTSVGPKWLSLMHMKNHIMLT